MATEPTRLNFNQRMQTIELMGAAVVQWGSGSYRTYRISLRGTGNEAHALHYNSVGSWVYGTNSQYMAYTPMTVGPSSIEAIMSLDMTMLQWLLE